MAQIIVYYAALTVMVQAAMASFKCPVLQNQALIPDPSDCRKYYHCLPGGRVFPMQCPNGLVFDTRQKVCIWDSTAKSCAPDTELPPPTQHQPSHTTKTPVTKGGHSRPKASKMTAPDQVNKPKNVISTARRNKEVQEAREKKKPVLTTPATTHSSTPTSATTSETSTMKTTEAFSTETKTSTASSKGAELEKHFSDAVDVINSLLSKVGPETASQGQHLASGTSSPPLTTTTTSSTLQGDSSDANKSVSQADESDKPKKGDNPSATSPLLKEENKGAHSVHRRSPDNKGLGNYFSDDVRCPSGFAYIPDPSNCATFYHCYNWQPMKKMCPPGLFFDHQTYVCNWPHNVNCIEGYRAKTLYSFNNFRRDRNEARETTVRIPKDKKEKTLKPSTARTTNPTTTSTTTTTTTELPTSRTTSAQITTQPLTSRSEAVNTESTRVLFEELDSVSMTTFKEVPHESVSQRLESKTDSTQNLLESFMLTDQSESENEKDASSSLSRISWQTTDTTAWSRVSNLPLEAEHVLADLYSNNDDLKRNASQSDEASEDSLTSSTSTETTGTTTTRLAKNGSNHQTAAPLDVSVATASGAPGSTSVQTSATSILSSFSDSNTPPAAQHQSTPPGGEPSNTSAPSPAQTSLSSFVSLAADNTTTTMPPPSPVIRGPTTPLSVMAARVPFYAMDSRHVGSSRSAASNTAYHRGSRLRARSHVPQGQSMSVSPFMPPAMAVSPFRTPAAQEFRSYDDVQIEKFMIKLLNDAMRSRHVVSRDVSDKTTSDPVTSSGLTREPSTGSVSNTGDGDRKHQPTTDDVDKLSADADIEEIDEDDSYVQEEVAPSTLFFHLPGNGLDFGTSTLQQDMHVSGVSHIEPQPYRQTLPLLADDQGAFFKKTASFPFAAREADSKEFENLVENGPVRENAKAKYIYDEKTMKAESQTTTGLDDKANEWDVKPRDLGLQMGYAYPKIFSNLGEEVDLSGDGETPEMTNHIPKIEAFSGILASDEQTNSRSNDPSQKETDDGIPVFMTSQDVSVPKQEDGAANHSTLAVDITQQTTLVTHDKEKEINHTDYHQSTLTSTVSDLSKMVPTETNQTNSVASKVSADNMSSSLTPSQSNSPDNRTTESTEQSLVTQTLAVDNTSTAKVEEAQEVENMHTVDNNASTTSVVNNTDYNAADGTTANELLSAPSDNATNTSLTEPASSLQHTDNNSLPVSLLQHTDNSSLPVSLLQHTDNSSLPVSSLQHTDNSSLPVSSLQHTDNNSLPVSSLQHTDNSSLPVSSLQHTDNSSLPVSPLENPGNSSVTETRPSPETPGNISLPETRSSQENRGNISLTESASSQQNSSNTSLTPSDKADMTPSPAFSTSPLEDHSQTSPKSTTTRSADSSNTSRESSSMMSNTHSNTSLSSTSSSSSTTSSSEASSNAPESSIKPSTGVTTDRPDPFSNISLSDSTQKAEVFMAKDLDSVPDNNTKDAEAKEVQVTVAMTTHPDAPTGDVSKGQQEKQDADDTVALPTNTSSDIREGTALLHTSQQNETAMLPSNNETAMLPSNNETAMLPSSNASIAAQAAAASNTSTAAAPDTENSTTGASGTNNFTITDADISRSTSTTFDTNSSTTTASDTHSSPTAASDTNSSTTIADLSSESPEIIAKNIFSIVNASVYSAAELEDRFISDFMDADSSTSVWRLAEGTGAPQEEQTMLLTAAKIEAETNDSILHNVTGQTAVGESVSSSNQVVLNPSLSPVTDKYPGMDRQLGDNDTQTASSVDATEVQKVSIDSAPYSGLINVSMPGNENIDDNTTSVNTSPMLDIIEDSIIDNDTEKNASKAVEQLSVAYLSDESLIKSSANEMLETKSDVSNLFETKDSSSLLSESEVVNEVQQVHEFANHSDLTTADNNTSQSGDQEVVGDTQGGAAAASLEETSGQEQTTVAENNTNRMSVGDDITTNITLFSPESFSDDFGSIAPGDGNERPHTSDNAVSHQRNVSVVVDKKSEDTVEETRENEDPHAHDTDKMATADVGTVEAADDPVVADAEGVGVKRSFVSLTDLITWYLKHWRNYTRWRQEHTTLPSSTPEP